MKKKLAISVDFHAKLPKYYIDINNISTIYCYVALRCGIFKDTDEITAENLLDYMSMNSRIDSFNHIGRTNYLNDLNRMNTNLDENPRIIPPSTQEYHEYFLKLLEENESVIHISTSSTISLSYHSAREAAEGLDNVYVIDSKLYSSFVTIVAIEAAKKANQGYSPKVIATIIDKSKNNIGGSFFVDKPSWLLRNENFPIAISNFLTFLNKKPSLAIKNGVIKVNGVFSDSSIPAWRQYIRHEFNKKNVRRIDKSFLLITYSNYDKSFLKLVIDEIAQLINFENIVTASSSCAFVWRFGSDSFSLSYMYTAENISLV